MTGRWRHIVFVFTFHYNSIPLVCLYNIKFTLIPLLCSVVDIICCLTGRFIGHTNCSAMIWVRSVNVWGQSREVSIARTLPSASQVLRSAKRAPANVNRLNNRKRRQRYCLVGERWRALALLNAAQDYSPGSDILVDNIWRQISDGILSVIVGWHWTVECACAISWNRIYVVQHDWNIDEHIWALILLEPIIMSVTLVCLSVIWG